MKKSLIDFIIFHFPAFQQSAYFPATSKQSDKLTSIVKTKSLVFNTKIKTFSPPFLRGLDVNFLTNFLIYSFPKCTVHY